MASRDDFNKPVVDALAKRAAYICSNPDCRKLTIAPSEEDLTKFIYIAEAAHIKAAAAGGPRYDPTMTSQQRSSIENALFLCSNCADMVDKNKGIDFSVEELHRWKSDHDEWIRNNLNKKFPDEQPASYVQNTTYNVNSNNQQGGITAGVVNVGPQPRKLKPHELSQLLQAFPDKSKSIRITAVMGDQEAFTYATELKDTLEKHSYRVDGIDQAVYTQPKKGVDVFTDTREIIVGSA
ncbi:hypothetical protein AB4258_23585 [Vibrio splendidus]